MNTILSNIISIFITGIIAFSVGHFVGGNPNFSEYLDPKIIIDKVMGKEQAAVDTTDLSQKFTTINAEEARKYCANFRTLTEICGNEKAYNYFDLDQETVQGIAHAAAQINEEYGTDKPEKFRIVFGINPYVSTLSNDKIFRLLVLPMRGVYEDLDKIRISENSLNCSFGCEKSEFVWKDGKDCLEQ